MVTHIVSVSGGKDSTALLLLAIARGKPFQAVHADTGHESPITVNYLNYLESKLGIKIRRIKADFSQQIENKKQTVINKWVADGVKPSAVKRALINLKPTGIPFLDLAIWKGRFPSSRAQFCTQHLKADPIFKQVIRPALAKGHIISWTGERRDESLRRSKTPKFSTTVDYETGHKQIRFRPLLHLSSSQVFNLHDAFGVKPNPLYKQGFTRVGCFPCIHARKKELKEISIRYPEAVKKLEKWEQIAGMASKTGQSTFFGSGTTPLSRRTGAIEPCKAIFDWALTDRGGAQKNLFLDTSTQCRSEYGLCE